jgi:hypothetical protein
MSRKHPAAETPRLGSRAAAAEAGALLGTLRALAGVEEERVKQRLIGGELHEELISLLANVIALAFQSLGDSDQLARCGAYSAGSHLHSGIERHPLSFRRLTADFATSFGRKPTNRQSSPRENDEYLTVICSALSSL